jgi:endonuclease VIII
VPEGHSLVLAARRLEPLVSQVVDEGPLAGERIVAVEARGKHLLIRSDENRVLDVHLGMHGSVRLAPPGAGRGRLVLRTAGGDAVIRASRVRLSSESRLRLPLGPDLLGEFDPGEFLRRIRLVDRPLGEALLDQRVCAGIGNIAKSEALWQCRADPFAPVSSFADEALVGVAGAASAILREGVERKGRLPSQVYRRTGRPCPRCDTPIRSAPQGEHRRTTYWCPSCQC